MHDNWLIAIAIITCGIGITILLGALLLLSPPEQSITMIKQLDDQTPVSLRGTITATRTIGNKTLITIEQPSTIDLIVDALLENNTLHKGDCIRASGKKTTYKSESATTIQVNTNRIVSC